ncbi:MAG: hypothetical protein B0W54_10305 [Cellvibrio sp. 79]|nr:MAG: hypothetical protein B0W54_10305 [Cellvibrio sp. 79]
MQDLPAIISRGAQQLFADDIYFAPVRHHSPACAFALKQLLAEIKPAAVLIEAPDSFNELIPLLTHTDTHPPVALLAQINYSKTGATIAGDNETLSSPDIRSGFFPFCDYSPEWIGLRDGTTLGATVAFIDLPWQEKIARANNDEQDNVENLQAERYLSHSHWLQLLAKNSGCRDHHELWDRFFEQRPPAQSSDWRTLFRDVFCWCAMARLDYEPAVLEAEQSLPRERHMASWIKYWRDKITGPIVVITGGFHTLELLGWNKAAPLPPAATKQNNSKQWLIRYGFAQLDALNHYAAGMPAPAYYQLLWEGLLAGENNPWQQAAQQLLQALVEHTRKNDLADALSTADLYAANNQAMGLAYLRGHIGPGRSELLDAVTSCFIKRESGDGYQGLMHDLLHLMRGSTLGNVPASAGSPPLVEDARHRAKAAGIKLDDSEQRNAHLDLYRKPAHRVRSRFFHLLDYLHIPFARRENGPDFYTGSRLDMLFEDWSYAWSPTVEAHLLELSSEGTSLHAVALRKLEREEQALAQQGQARSAARATQLVTRACLIGLHQRLNDLLTLVNEHLREDSSFASVVNTGHQLLTLLQAREPLELNHHPMVIKLLHKVWLASIFLLPELALCKPEQEADAIVEIIALRDFIKRAPATLAEQQIEIDSGLFHAPLKKFVHSPLCNPAIKACALALLYLDNQYAGPDIAALVVREFGPGVDVEKASSFLYGLMRTAPELLICEQTLLSAINQLVMQWSEADFIAFLPELRRAFTYLQPQETDQLARTVCTLNGSTETIFEYNQTLSEQDLHQGLQLQQALHNALVSDGLAHWLAATTNGDNQP